jgi:hypothetical protein
MKEKQAKQHRDRNQGDSPPDLDAGGASEGPVGGGV